MGKACLLGCGREGESGNGKEEAFVRLMPIACVARQVEEARMRCVWHVRLAGIARKLGRFG